MTTPTLGESVKNAVRFVQRIHRDVGALIKNLDEEMSRQGWQPTERKISDDLSNKLDEERWIIKDIFRIYIEREPAAATRAAVTHVIFDPPGVYAEPLALIGALRFGKPVAGSELWNVWAIEGSEAVLTALAGRSITIELTPQLFKAGFFPEACSGCAFQVPLCGLTSEQDLRQKAVAPLVGVLKTLAER